MDQPPKARDLGLSDEITELYNSIDGTYLSLPQLIVGGSSGRRKVLMVKFLTAFYVYFYCFDIMDKNLSLNPTPVGKLVGTIQLISQ